MPKTIPGHWANMRALLWIVVLMAGCGGGERTPATVRGRVLFQGQPLAGGTIVFAPHPERGPAAKPAIAVLDHQGCYRLEAEGSPYLAAGWYRIAVADAGTPETWAYFPAPLRRPDRSGLEREIVAGQDNVFDFHLGTSP
jgi:hypothetical protein